MRKLVFSLLFVSLAACGGDRAVPVADDRDPLIIQAYAVPPATEREVESVINSLLSVGDAQLGRARVLPNRMVVVSAPASAHGGIRMLIEQLEDLPPTGAERIRLHYWLVRGEAAPETDVPANLGMIEAALRDTAAGAGSMRFQRIDYVQHSLRSGSDAAVDGGALDGHVEAAARGDRIALNLSLSARTIHRSVRAEMDMDSGETVVLAQVGGDPEDEADRGAVNLFVVRAERF